MVLLNKSRAKLKAHTAIYGPAQELSREELERIATRDTIPYTDHVFTGKYHLKNIASKYPIAGTQLRIERERELSIAAKTRLLEVQSEEIRAKRMPNALRISNKQSRDKEAFQLSRDMSRLEHRFTKMNTMLETHLADVQSDLVYRQHRLATHACSDEQLGAFWDMLQRDKWNQVKTTVIDGVFKDINVAVAWDAKHRIMTQPAKSQDLAITPLMYCCRHMVLDAVEVLLKHGAEPRISTANGATAFHYVMKDWPEHLSAKKTSLLFTMCAQKVSRLLRLLLEYKGDCTCQNTYGDTVLHYCATYGLQDGCEVLLRLRGADGTIKNRHGLSPADLAQRNGLDYLYRILQNAALLGEVARDATRTKCIQ